VTSAKVILEAGYEPAMIGVSLSWASNVERAKQIAPNLAHKQGGHNKFLESIMIWIDTDFPRDLWSEADTYRISTKQSESTMHTLSKRHLTQEDFDKPIPEKMIEIVNKSGRWKNPVVTKLESFLIFYPAENYHQDYLQKNPAGYTCHFVRFGSYL